ncbi:MAG: hypothetical protein N2Z81_00870 [Hydrogenothermaceae bacterium]|nr:hypothetical protein [Hydrogenothermaceae bacterium]
MRKIILSILIFAGISFAQSSGITTSEYLDQARDALKKAYESGAHVKAPYEYSKASAYYSIAKESASNFSLDNAVEASKKSIEWSLKAIEKTFKGVEK